MKVHITLVGGQPAPIYNGIIATAPDKVVFVYSKSSLSVVKKIENEINISIDWQPPLDETDPSEISKRALLLYEQYKNDEVTLNISSGLKSWSHLFGRVFDNAPNASVVYMDQNNVLWNYKTMTSERNFSFDMKTLFRLYGNDLKAYKSIDDYTAEDKKAICEIEELRGYNNYDFNLLTVLLKDDEKKIFNNQMSGHFDLSLRGSKSEIDWKKPSNGDNGCVKIKLYKKLESHCIKRTLLSPHIVSLVFNSGWFEYKVANIVSKWAQAKEVYMNCVFPSKFGAPKNEVDIILNTGNRIIFFECKVKIKKPTDIDKFRSVVRNYGGMGSKGIFVVMEKISGPMKEKFWDNNIIPFSMIEHTDPENDLIKLLNKVESNINIR